MHGVLGLRDHGAAATPSRQAALTGARLPNVPHRRRRPEGARPNRVGRSMRPAHALLADPVPRYRSRGHPDRAGCHQMVRPGVSGRVSCSAGSTSGGCWRGRVLAGNGRPFAAEQGRRLLLYMTVGRDARRPARLRAVLRAGLLPREPAGDPRLRKGGMAFHGALVGACSRSGCSPAATASIRGAHGRPARRGGADRPVLRPHRQLHQRRAVRPPDRRALGHGVPRG